MTGRATTALNSFFFVGAFIVQFAIGIVIDLVPATEAGHYPTLAYQLAFAVMIGLQLSAWAVAAREAACDRGCRRAAYATAISA